MTQDLVLFLILASFAILTAISMLVSKNAVHAALFLVLNFFTAAVLYLLLDAPFIAMVQVTVYAGAIMVLFLFVIMLLGAEQAGQGESIRWQIPAAIIFGVGLIAEFIVIILTRSGNLGAGVGDVAQGFGSPAAIGEILFNRYLVPFEITSVLLLVAMIGAIVLSRAENKEEG
jgi:NADH-quinone oxidoreductase subunit J